MRTRCASREVKRGGLQALAACGGRGLGDAGDDARADVRGDGGGRAAGAGLGRDGDCGGEDGEGSELGVDEHRGQERGDVRVRRTARARAGGAKRRKEKTRKRAGFIRWNPGGLMAWEDVEKEAGIVRWIRALFWTDSGDDESLFAVPALFFWVSAGDAAVVGRAAPPTPSTVVRCSGIVAGSEEQEGRGGSCVAHPRGGGPVTRVVQGIVGGSRG